jgi:FtsH-binding integral membrane protein
VIGEQTEGNAALASRLSIVGSLVLYLDFINLFLFILELMNQNRRS